jgi:hypothetical protein
MRVERIDDCAHLAGIPAVVGVEQTDDVTTAMRKASAEGGGLADILL